MLTLTIQVRLDDWHDAGKVTLLGNAEEGKRARTTVEYDLDYALAHLEATGREAFSLGMPVRTVDYQFDSWPPFLLDLFPEGAALRHIERHHGIPIDEANSWEILQRVVIAPPGNLRIKPREQPSNTHEGFERQEVVDHKEDFIDHMLECGAPIGGTSGIGGGAPKVLLREDLEGRFHAEMALPDEKTKGFWIVKFARGTASDDRMILQNEQRYHDIARKVGLRVGEPLAWESDCLFVPRFDRRRVGDRWSCLGLESFYSCIGSTIQGQHFDHEDFLELIRTNSAAPAEDIVEYLQRQLLAEMMGDTDNHGRNSAFLKTGEETRLSPLFDFAPMKFDPEMIAPVTRWSRREWDLTRTEKELAGAGVFKPGGLRSALKPFADQVMTLDDTLARHGVDTRVITGTAGKRARLIALLREFVG